MRLAPGLLVFLLLPFQLLAQPSPTSTPAASATTAPTLPTRLEFAVYVWPTEGILLEDSRIAALPNLFYSSPTGPRPVRLVRNGTTPLLPYAGPLPLRLYELEEVWTDPPADAPPGTPATMVLSSRTRLQVNIPADWTRALIVLFPDKQGPDGTLLSIPLPYGMEQLRPGMARIYNGSDRTLILEFPDAANRRLVLHPFQNLDFTPDNLTDRLTSRVFVYGSNSRGEAEMVHTSRLFFEKETTNYFFLYPEGPRRIRILRVAGHANPVPTPLPTPAANAEPPAVPRR